MLLVAGSVAAVLQVYVAVGSTLRYFALQKTVFLLCIYFRNKTLLCLEVESHGVALVFVLSHAEHGSTHQRVSGRVGSVACSGGMYERRVEAHVYLLGFEVHVLIFHLRLSV